ncbi:MAG TPA: hypothetical protein VER33_27765 [Polyangiaceae bacterium]|nr:hypothetical protein [Polyangiaceae bacterium]
MHGQDSSFASGVLCAMLLSVAACDDYPRDPEGTLKRIQSSGLVRAGCSNHPPWVELSGAMPRGTEVVLVDALARELGARVAWQGGAENLLTKLEEYELDVVVGGFANDTPWQERVAMSRPYAEQAGKPRVWLFPPGENAWQLRAERFLLSASARQLLTGESQ